MNELSTLQKITNSSKEIEEIFLSLSQTFPKLLNKQNDSSLEQLQTLFATLKDNSNLSSDEENVFFKEYISKYSVFFNTLNESIDELHKIDKQIKEIKTISEEMELIALNAMVISIKSGEKGRAFSCITENLKRLSGTMNSYANNLITSENILIETINSLQILFTSLTDSQKRISSISNSVSIDVATLINQASAPLNKIKEDSQKIYQPICKAMEGIQLQDIIRQSLDQVILALKECKINTNTSTNEEKLDQISFSISLKELESSVLEDTISRINESSNIFSSNWDIVNKTFTEIENEKNSYIHTVLSSDNSNTSIVNQLINIENKYDDFVSGFSSYQHSQKNLIHTCNSITSKVIAMDEVFSNLSPVIDQLHHVRILQEIEVSKNLAISTVKNFVTDMDKLISTAKTSVEIMQTNVETFITKINSLVSKFSESIITDNEKMDKLKISKFTFFTSIKEAKNNINNTMQNFSVFPKDFTTQYNLVQNYLSTMSNIDKEFLSISNDLKTQKELEIKDKNELLQQTGMSQWEIRNDKFKNLINHFTITAHKQTAGQIAGFNVEAGKEAGEITFF